MYDHLGEVKIQRSHYDVITYINTAKIKQQIDQLKDTIRVIKDICGTTACGSEVLPSKDFWQKINEDYNGLTEILGNRMKRSWYSTIQDTVKIIHGIINENEMFNYEQLIHKELIQDRDSLNKALGKISIIQNNISRHNDKLSKLEINVDELKNTFQSLIKSNNVTRVEIGKLKLIQSIQALDSYKLNILQDIQTILTALMFAKRNALHPKIISPRKLLSELQISTKHLPSHLHFPYSLLEQNTEGMINIAEIKVFRVNTLLVFVISNPLIVDEIFNLYKLIPYPTRFIDKQFIYVSPKEEFLFINEQRTLFTLLSDINGCKTVHPELFLCKIDKPLFNRINNKLCEVEILVESKLVLKNCDIRIIQLESEIWEKIHFFNTWIYVVPRPTTLRVVCPHNTTEYIIENSGVITLTNECWASTSKIHLYPKQTKFDEKYNSVIPKMDISSLISPLEEKIQEFMIEQNNSITFVHDFEELSSIGIPIQSIIDTDETSISNIVIVITTTVSMLLIFIVLLMWLKKSKAVKKKNIQDNLQQNVSNNLDLSKIGDSVNEQIQLDTVMENKEKAVFEIS